MFMNLIFSWLQHSATLSIDIQQLCGWWVGNIEDGRWCELRCQSASVFAVVRM